MRKFSSLSLFFYFAMNASIGQPFNIESSERDILVFQFINNNVRLLDDSYTIQVYKTDSLIIGLQKWQNYSWRYIEKQYLFLHEKDTMKITCQCGQEHHLYFENLEFRKSYFTLKIKAIERPMLSGAEISKDRALRALLFIDAFTPWDHPETLPFGQQDLIFEKIRFYRVDLRNTDYNVLEVDELRK